MEFAIEENSVEWRCSLETIGAVSILKSCAYFTSSPVDLASRVEAREKISDSNYIIHVIRREFFRSHEADP